MANHIPNCKLCSKPGIRNDKYDAYYCTNCVVWIEKQCDDVECIYCPNRPETPHIGE